MALAFEVVTGGSGIMVVTGDHGMIRVLHGPPDVDILTAWKDFKSFMGNNVQKDVRWINYLMASHGFREVHYYPERIQGKVR